jgi:hypothetical protein
MTVSRTSVLRSQQAELSCLLGRSDGSSSRRHPGCAADAELSLKRIFIDSTTGSSTFLAGGGRVMAASRTEMLRLWQAGLSRPAWPQQKGPKSVPDSKSCTPVAVLAGGVFPPRLAAPTGSEVAPLHYPRVLDPRFLRRRVDPQAEFGRRACGERVAKPTPTCSNQPNPRSKNK